MASSGLIDIAYVVGEVLLTVQLPPQKDAAECPAERARLHRLGKIWSQSVEV